MTESSDAATNVDTDLRSKYAEEAAEAVAYDPVLQHIKQDILQGDVGTYSAIDQQLDAFSKRYNTAVLKDPQLRQDFINNLLATCSSVFGYTQDLDQSLLALRNQVVNTIFDANQRQLSQSLMAGSNNVTACKPPHSAHAGNSNKHQPHSHSSNGGHTHSTQVDDADDAKVVTVTMVCHLGDQYGSAGGYSAEKPTVSVEKQQKNQKDKPKE